MQIIVYVCVCWLYVRLRITMVHRKSVRLCIAVCVCVCVDVVSDCKASDRFMLISDRLPYMWLLGFLQRSCVRWKWRCQCHINYFTFWHFWLSQWSDQRGVMPWRSLRPKFLPRASLVPSLPRASPKLLPRASLVPSKSLANRVHLPGR